MRALSLDSILVFAKRLANIFPQVRGQFPNLGHNCSPFARCVGESVCLCVCAYPVGSFVFSLMGHKVEWNASNAEKDVSRSFIYNITRFPLASFNYCLHALEML